MADHAFVSDPLTDPMFAARYAEHYIDAGYRPIPLREKGKVPISKDWHLSNYTRGEAASAFPSNANVGVILGTEVPNIPPSSPDYPWRFVSLDVDSAPNDTTTRARVLQCFKPATIPVRTGKDQRIQLFFLTDAIHIKRNSLSYSAIPAHPFAVARISNTGKPLYAEMEVRGPTHQTMIAPSVHPDSLTPTCWMGPPLHSYHVFDLPRVSRFRLQEVFAIFLEPTSPIHQLADCGPGNIHNTIVSATAWMANNKWPDQDVEDRMTLLWEQLTEDYDDLGRSESEFTDEWQRAFKSARAKFQDEEKPSKSAKDTFEKNKAQIERLMADWWRTKYTQGNVAPAVDFFGNVRLYDQGWWKIIDRKSIIREIGGQFDVISSKKGKEAYETLISMSLPPVPNSNSELICCLNATVNLRTLAVTDHSPDDGLLISVPFDFVPHAACPLYDKFLSEVFHQQHFEDGDLRTAEELAEDQRTMIDTWEEFAGYSLTEDVSLQTMLIVIGPPGSGKTTLATIMTWILPEEATFGASLKNMEDPRFHPAILDKRLNICPETGTTYSGASEFINATVAGDLQVVRQMREEAVRIRSSVKLMFLGNRMLKTNDTSGAIQRRMAIVLLPNARLDPSVQNTKLGEQLRAESSAIFSRFVVAGNRLFNRGHFLQSHFSGKAKADNKSETDSVHTWFDDRCEHTPNEWMINEHLYADYANWAKMSGFKNVNSSEWGKRLSNIDIRLKSDQRRVLGTPRRAKMRQVGFQPGVTPDCGPTGGSTGARY